MWSGMLEVMVLLLLLLSITTSLGNLAERQHSRRSGAVSDHSEAVMTLEPKTTILPHQPNMELGMVGGYGAAALIKHYNLFR